MLWMAMVYLLYLFLITPITVQFRFSYRDKPERQVIVHVWGLPVRIPDKDKKKKTRISWRKLIKELRELIGSFEVQLVTLQGSWAASSPDLTAQGWGVLCSIQGWAESWMNAKGIPHYVRITPAFDRQRPTLEGGCILFVRLGKLMAPALRLGLAYRREMAALKEERAIWSIRSGA